MSDSLKNDNKGGGAQEGNGAKTVTGANNDSTTVCTDMNTPTVAQTPPLSSIKNTG